MNNVSFTTRSDSDTIGWDSIKVSFTIPQYTILYAAITCNSEFPGDQEIINQDTQLTRSSNLNLFYYFETETPAVRELVLSGLKRQTNYRMRLILSTINSTGAKATILKTVDKLTKTSGTEPVSIRLPDTIKTICGQFSFSLEVSSKIQQQVINYCQNIFSVNEGVTEGCVVCSNESLNMFTVGTTISPFNCLSSNSLRMLQDTNTNTEEEVIDNNSASVIDPTKVAYSFVVCAIQDLLCPTQLTQESYDLLATDFISDLNNPEKFNSRIQETSRRSLQTIPFLGVEQISDAPLPEIKLCQADDTSAGCCRLGEFKLQPSGQFNFDLTCQEKLICHYKIIQDQTELPSAADIRNCSDNRCGTIKTSRQRKVNVIQTTVNNPFTRGSTFSAYLNCPSYNVVNAKEDSQLVLKIVSSTIPLKNCPKPELDLDAVSDECTCLNLLEVKIPQGEEGDDCFASLLKIASLSLTLLLSMVLIF